MAKSKFPITDSGATEPREMSPEQHAHFKGLATNLIDNAVAVGHGVGSQGPKGHKMVANDLHKQQGSYIPQGAVLLREQHVVVLSAVEGRV